MRTAIALAVAVLALPSLAAARPITVGAGVGRIQSKVDANGDASDTVQLFGRLGLTQRLAAQLEIQKVDAGSENANLRTFTGVLVVDLGHSGHLYPTIAAGFGIDRASDPYGYYEMHGTHIEGGFGLEYRADGGLVLGAEFRLGGRTIDNQDDVQPLYNNTASGAPIALYAPSTLESGEYRCGRVFAAIRF